MLWTWDSVDISFDQICWSFDGYDGCYIPPPPSPGGGSGGGYTPGGTYIDTYGKRIKLPLKDNARIAREHQRILDFTTVILTKGIL